MGYGEDLKAMQSIGYRHMVDYLKGRLTWEEAVRTLKRDTRRFAKRQFTWFKADHEIHWTSPEGMPALYPQIEAFLNKE
jgi:tRNA dimethylallyltransferase